MLKTPRKFILGTVQFGLQYGINTQGRPSPEEVFRILDTAHDSGIELLDTADVYGNAQELIGGYHRQTGKRFRVNTKFIAETGKTVREQLLESLEKLDLRQVQVYFFHRFDDFSRSPELTAQLAGLKEEGLVKQAGVSVYTGDELEAAILAPPVDVIQIPFNLLDNTSQKGHLLDRAIREGKEIQVRSVFLQGLFFMDEAKIPGVLAPLAGHLQHLHRLCSRFGLSMQQLALNYALSNPAISHVLIGVDTNRQLLDNLHAIIPGGLPEEVIEAVNTIQVQETRLLSPANWS